MSNTKTKSKAKVSHSHNGLITKIWGESAWIFNHCVTFDYPVCPTTSQKKKCKKYFELLGEMLPCRYCRESYKYFIAHGKTALTDSVLESRDNLVEWFYNIHNAVNEKLEMDYGITLSDHVDKYESFRANDCVPNIHSRGCSAPLEYKAISFKNLHSYSAPIVHLSKIEPYIEIARTRGLSEINFCFLELAFFFNGDFTQLKKQKAWKYRNYFCQIQIKYMQENAIPSIESNGPWKGTPTIEELKLLLFLSSNLNRTELNACTENLLKKLK